MADTASMPLVTYRHQCSYTYNTDEGTYSLHTCSQLHDRTEAVVCEGQKVMLRQTAKVCEWSRVTIKHVHNIITPYSVAQGKSAIQAQTHPMRT